MRLYDHFLCGVFSSGGEEVGRGRGPDVGWVVLVVVGGKNSSASEPVKIRVAYGVPVRGVCGGGRFRRGPNSGGTRGGEGGARVGDFGKLSVVLRSLHEECSRRCGRAVPAFPVGETSLTGVMPLEDEVSSSNVEIIFPTGSCVPPSSVVRELIELSNATFFPLLNGRRPAGVSSGQCPRVGGLLDTSLLSVEIVSISVFLLLRISCLPPLLKGLPNLKPEISRAGLSIFAAVPSLGRPPDSLRCGPGGGVDHVACGGIFGLYSLAATSLNLVLFWVSVGLPSTIFSRGSMSTLVDFFNSEPLGSERGRDELGLESFF